MGNKYRIYLLDDCESTTFLIKKWLEPDFDVEVFHTPMSFISGFQAKKPDLCLLDVQLNDNRNGLDVLKELQLRGKIKIPFIFISQEFQNFRKTNAYQLGAVDYIKKPLEKDELKHKVSNILDLIYSSQNQSQDIISLDENNLSFTMKIEDEDIVVRLTPKEFVIFKQLIKNKDSIVTREQILSRLEDSLNEKFVVDRVIDVHVCNIKKKLGPHKNIINSVYGVGYKFDTTKAA
ncbi:MAG: response regulator transcription factor [Bacteriovoracaceae bacterium]|jgi:DNA-binding response OmpR family regulator|nr:response regulator transcription factor [Bacteriovoracaceae bacterium]|tara:strand:- start:366 stop:1067 length:702 start_codon:yes stop_codon:yes gene_type:complete